ncbi:hypothetical protein [Methylomonas sp. MK1]|uniref:hypothetical protein n=1 Tax=Methylomonas sp. MK1 TaxID=1131552 RepID=UPI0003751960|nr:hypothetical protein [Methylomonas sp. MK1]
MDNHPAITPGEKIQVGLHDFIVQSLFPPNSQVHVCWVIYLHRGKPTKCPVGWNGKEWFISDEDAITYVRESEPFMRELKQLGESDRWLYQPWK